MSDDARGRSHDGDVVPPAELLLNEVRAGYRREKAHGEGALGQLDSEDWHRRPDPESNSVAILVRHLAGNMRSRWRDVFTSDGEKPARQRDDEFEPTDDHPEALMVAWDEGWRTLSIPKNTNPEHGRD